VAGNGQVWVSADAGQTWEPRGQLGGPPEALLAHGGTLYAAAQEHSIVTSVDEGANWRMFYSPGGHVTR
jgi:hypothetical protein